MKSVSDKVLEEIKAHILFPVTFIENLAVSEIMFLRRQITDRQSFLGTTYHKLLKTGKTDARNMSS
jgi:hypothetical protein